MQGVFFSYTGYPSCETLVYGRAGEALTLWFVKLRVMHDV